VSFGDTVPYPPPKKCHVLFEWPLIVKFSKEINLSSLKIDLRYAQTNSKEKQIDIYLDWNTMRHFG
jgi:hypothetical protein